MNLLDTMSYNKMNVLHLHASDLCRFSVESNTYPELTANLTGLQAGYYTQVCFGLVWFGLIWFDLV